MPDPRRFGRQDHVRDIAAEEEREYQRDEAKERAQELEEEVRDKNDEQAA